MLLEDAKLDCEYHPQLHRAPYIHLRVFHRSPAHYSVMYSFAVSLLLLFLFCFFGFEAKAVTRNKGPQPWAAVINNNAHIYLISVHWIGRLWTTYFANSY